VKDASPTLLHGSTQSRPIRLTQRGICLFATISDTHYVLLQIGLEHGRRLSAQIKAQIKVYEAMFKTTSKLDWSAVREIAKAYAATVESLTPALYTEMLAIAEGADLDVLDIVALNARSEIALGLFSDGCTSLGWKYSEGQVYLCQNWDWTARVKENILMMSIDQPGKPKIWMVTEVHI